MRHWLTGHRSVISLAHVAAGICFFLSVPGSAQEIKPRTTLNIEGIEALAFSPDGKTLATGGRVEKTVKLWDVLSGKSIATLESGKYTVKALAFSPDGTTLAAFSHDTITLFDCGTRKAKATLKTSSSFHHEVLVVFSPDGKTLACGGSCFHGIEVWNVASAKQTMKFERDDGSIGGTCAMEFSSDGKSLLSASRGRAGLLQSDLVTGKTTATLFWDGESGIKQFAISADGKVAVAWAAQDKIVIRDIAAGKTRIGHKDLKGAYSPALSADGKLLAFERSKGAIKIWDMKNETEVATLQGGGEYFTRLVFSRDGSLLASVNDDDVVKIWDVPKAK